MADVSISKFTQLIRLQGQASVPSLPPSTEDTPPAVNPPGSGGLTGVNQFIQLTDTPATYSGATLNYARVNAGETGLEFRTPAQVLADIGGIGGTIASGQVAFGTGTGTIGGDSGLVWDNVNKRLGIGITPNQTLDLAGSISLGDRGIALTRSIGLTAFNNFGGNSSHIRFVSQSSTINGLEFYINGAYGVRFFSGGSELYRFDNVGRLGLLTTSPTETLDVNGTTRIRTINNLGSTPTEVLVPSATGVVSKRTLAELASDGLGSKWTDVGSDIYRNSSVAIGRTSIPTNNTFSVQSTKTGSSDKFFLILNNAGTERYSLQQGGTHTWSGATANFNLATRISATGLGNRSSAPLHITETAGGSNRATLNIYNSSGVRQLSITNQGNLFFETSTGRITFVLGGNINTDTTTGTKIGTATTQKLAFWNATPIVQPTTSVAEGTFVENAGGTAVNVDSTFDGYTLQQVVRALRNTGLLA